MSDVQPTAANTPPTSQSSEDSTPASPASTSGPPPQQTSQQTVVGPDRVVDPVGDYPERPYDEAKMREDGTEVPNFDPSRADHQEVRVKESADYLVGDLRELGYEGPEYGGD